MIKELKHLFYGGFMEFEYKNTSKKKRDIRLYALKHNDIFSISEKSAFDVMSNNGSIGMFVPIERYKRVVWYKPSTWFRWIWRIEYRLID
jgi:hypothetical protein